MQFDNVGKHSTVLSARGADLVSQTDPLGGFGTYQGGIIPGNLGQRFRQFLQPTVVGEAAVEKRRIGLKRNLQGVLPSFRLAVWDFSFRVSSLRDELIRTTPASDLFESNYLGFEGRTRNDAVVQCCAPEEFKIAGGLLAFPVVSNNIVGCLSGPA